MQNILFALSLGFGGLILTLQQAYSQPASCGDRAQIVERLGAKYNESRRSIALGQNNSVVEMFASKDTGSWTLLVTLPNGQSCVVGAGEAYEAVDDTVTIPSSGA